MSTWKSVEKIIRYSCLFLQTNWTWKIYWRSLVVDKGFTHTRWIWMCLISVLSGRRGAVVSISTACILRSSKAWQQCEKSTGSLSAHGFRANDLSPEENVWKQSREFSLLCSGYDQVWLLAEQCWGAQGVLIGGKWHDAQSQQWIVYLTHL